MSPRRYPRSAGASNARRDLCGARSGGKGDCGRTHTTAPRRMEIDVPGDVAAAAPRNGRRPPS